MLSVQLSLAASTTNYRVSLIKALHLKTEFTFACFLAVIRRSTDKEGNTTLTKPCELITNKYPLMRIHLKLNKTTFLKKLDKNQLIFGAALKFISYLLNHKPPNIVYPSPCIYWFHSPFSLLYISFVFGWFPICICYILYQTVSVMYCLKFCTDL